MIKKRYYLRCVRDYLTLFKNNSIIEQSGGLAKPYIYNDQFIETDPFFIDPSDF